ncbi:hypothetical protein F2Q69_00059214 [Brassica cretica]|uniref:Uncharacterized protein n=1 Tax=Brassica cretica TaxID=69181 RepID=A0A8S9RMK8_BRACR|nr:hypothetical protein F2Q69_00059214 [Brassica cretica]
MYPLHSFVKPSSFFCPDSSKKSSIVSVYIWDKIKIDTSVLYCVESALSRKQLDLSLISRGVDRQEDIVSIDVEVLVSIDGEVVMSIDCEVVQSIDIEAVPSVDVEVLPSVDVEVIPSVDVEVLLSVDVEVLPSVDIEVVPSVDVEVVPSVDVEVVPSVDVEVVSLVDVEVELPLSALSNLLRSMLFIILCPNVINQLSWNQIFPLYLPTFNEHVPLIILLLFSSCFSINKKFVKEGSFNVLPAG